MENNFIDFRKTSKNSIEITAKSCYNKIADRTQLHARFVLLCDYPKGLAFK